MQKAPPTPKGFRDILPEAAKKRRETINKIADVLESEGFSPIETPTIEFAETLTGKYGEEEKLIYKFKDRGDRDLALRYDLTVPLARFIAANQNLITKGPFRRYQIGQVFRGENPQHGRWREFTQFDFDTVGSDNPEEDAKIIACAQKSVKSLGLPNARVLINDRANFAQTPIDVIRAVDKLHKIGEEGIKEELKTKNMALDEIEESLFKIKNAKPTKNLEEIFSVLKKDYSLKEGQDFMFDPTLARGLDYYTGAIFELKPSSNTKALTIGAGGRYDNLIGMFVYPANGGAGKPIPAVGFSFGIDRLIEAIT
ncbi:MAG: histidine--tRNA ligase [Candidatus Curtissbacteria bacterium]|nr:histidine--tRNA ligase [Candidatus Curtissbacteria bacterium]